MLADVKELAFALYNAAIGEKERDLIPRVGLATDRRALGHVGEVFHEENASVLMCFICSCKKLCHEGVDKFGNPMHKGLIRYRTGDTLKNILTGGANGSLADAWKYNLSAKFYNLHFHSNYLFEI